MTLLDQLTTDIQERHPRSLRGIEEARATNPVRFDHIVEQFLQWTVAARGVQALPLMADAFVAFCYDVNLAQARYEVEGHYACSTFKECYDACYGRNDFMDDYLWGVYLTNVLWAHHFELSLFYEDRFLSRLGPTASLIEIAPGHGGWGVWALRHLPDASLLGFDVSPQAIRIAESVARAAGVGGRARYAEKNVFEIDREHVKAADGLVCCFLLEHLEEPALLMAVIAQLLRPGGVGFITGALTAAQVDHIFEFRYESELVALCEQHGLRVLETMSANPRRTLARARFLPRSMALVVTRRTNDLF